MKAPFPYFGGKSSIAPIVWRALGQPKHYIEPFFGSGAVLLSRPEYDPAAHIETVNDKDGFISNVWRALQADPDAVARWCDWPVNHADLSARKRVLIASEGKLLEGLIGDDTWFDAKLAGYWVWAASCWIGSGLTSIGSGLTRPDIAGAGRGVHAIGSVSPAIGQIPHMASSGKGVHAIGSVSPANGKDVRDKYNARIYAWFRQLSERLRRVRVVCGEWNRVCGGDWQDKNGLCGMFFDPPYGVEDRDKDLYHHDNTDTVAASVREWCLTRGDRSTCRIVLAGYVEEHAELLEHGWRLHQWSAQSGYGNLSRENGSTRGKDNRHREALFFSPHCRDEAESMPLFTEGSVRDA